MNTVNCLIVDDEPLARDILQTYINDIPGWKVVKACINAAEAYSALHENQVHVMFLDIQMPVISGVDFLRSLKDPPLVVFTTAYSYHAVEGFALNAVDYLMKPVTQVRFTQSVAKLKDRLNTNFQQSVITPGQVADYIFIKQDAKLVKIQFDDFLYAEARRDFTYIFLKQRKLLASMHLKMLEDLLPGNRFVRVHRSFMINIAAVTAIQPGVVEIDKHEIPVGASFKDRLLDMLGM